MQHDTQDEQLRPRPPGHGRMVVAGVVGALALGVGLGLWARPTPPAEARPVATRPEDTLRPALQVIIDDTPAPIGPLLEVLGDEPGSDDDVAPPLPPLEPMAPRRAAAGLMKVDAVIAPEPALLPVEKAEVRPRPSRKPADAAPPTVRKAKADPTPNPKPKAKIADARMTEARIAARKAETAKAERAAKAEKLALAEAARAKKAEARKAELRKTEIRKAEARKVEAAKLARADAAKRDAKARRLAALETSKAEAKKAKAEAARKKQVQLAAAKKVEARKTAAANAARKASVEKASLRQTPKPAPKKAAPRPAVKARGEGPMRVARNDTCASQDPGEAVVCADGRLGARDRQLQQAYRNAEAAGVPANALRRQQARWLQARAAAAREAPWAVEDVYEARISELNDLTRDAREN